MMNMVNCVDGRVALVTGGSRGIGRAVALRLADSHEAVVITYRVARDEASRVVEQIKSRGKQALAVQCDHSQVEAGEVVVAAAVEHFGAVDSLVNNAGVAERRSFVDLTTEEWCRSLGVNLTSAFVTMRAAVPLMLARGRGSIVNMGSPAGLHGGIVGAHYSASKAGLIGLTVQAARELTASGIRVNLVEPAAVETDMVQDLLAADDELRVVTASGRRGTPAEVAAVVAFLCSDEASYVSGSVIGVSGGGF